MRPQKTMNGTEVIEDVMSRILIRATSSLPAAVWHRRVLSMYRGERNGPIMPGVRVMATRKKHEQKTSHSSS
jgi:hypothetical protein